MPSNEKTLIFEASIVMTEFTFSIKAEKEILVFKIDPPISRISEEIKDVKYIKNSPI